jgi:hypothetical protein
MKTLLIGCDSCKQRHNADSAARIDLAHARSVPELASPREHERPAILLLIINFPRVWQTAKHVDRIDSRVAIADASLPVPLS